MQKPGLFGMNGFVVCMLMVMSVTASAQQTGSLILMDAENKQAFTVSLGDQMYASSANGHLVLSRLKDSTYRLHVRFPKKNITELIFPVTIHQKDLGFQLKGSDSSWVLFNWQTKQTIRAVNEQDSSRILEHGVKREDGFSRLMAAVVNDTSVMYDTYTGNGFSKDSAVSKSQTPVPALQNPVSAAKSPASANQNLALATPKPNPVAEGPANKTVSPVTATPQPPAVAVQAPVIRNEAAVRDSLARAKKMTRDSVAAARKASKDSLLLARKTVKDSLDMVRKAAKDSITASKKMGVKADTLLAVKKPSVVTDTVQKATLQPTSVSKVKLSSVKKLREVSLKISRKLVFADVGNDGHVDTVTLFVYFENTDSLPLKPVVAVPVVAEKKPVRAGCTQLAAESDVESLRLAILEKNTEAEKIGAASVVFASKCFSVAQIRVLAALFVSDKAKYNLMDAAHLHISDIDHFHELVDMYTDKNFQKKFLQLADKRS
jgi:hypothetical protein